MPEIDERIAEFLNEKLGSNLAPPPLMERLHAQLSAVVVALVALVESAAARLKDALTYRPAAAATPARSALRQELADHLRDAYDAKLEQGCEPDAAWAHVTSHFGDYEAILGELEELHQPTPLWEWITRALALPLALWLMESVWHGGYVSLGIKNFMMPTCFLALLVAAPLAAWNPPGGWRWLTRTLGLGVLMFSLYEEGFHRSDYLSAGMIVVILALLARPFSSPQFATRLRAFMLAAMAANLVLCARLFLVLLESSHSYKVGAGLAWSFVYVIWGIYLARPAWGVLLLMIAYCQGTVFILMRALMTPGQAAIPISINQEFMMTPLICTCLAFLAGWTFFSRRAYACWLPAIGVVAMILTYYTRLKNLSDPLFSIPGLMLSASLPLLLWLAPAAGVVYRKFQRVE